MVWVGSSKLHYFCIGKQWTWLSLARAKRRGDVELANWAKEPAEQNVSSDRKTAEELDKETWVTASFHAILRGRFCLEDGWKWSVDHMTKGV